MVLIYCITLHYVVAFGKGSKKTAAKDVKKADVKKGSGKEKDKVPQQ